MTVDLLVTVMTADHHAIVMTADHHAIVMNEEVAEVGEVHHEMIADHHQCVETTVDREIEMTVELVMIAARTTGVQDLVDFHLHHVMTAEEEEMIKEKTEVKGSLQGMMDLLSVLQNQNRNLHKEEKLQMDGPLLSNDNL